MPSFIQRINAGMKAATRGVIPSSASGWSIGMLPRTRYDFERNIGTDRLLSTSIPAAVLGWIGRNFPSAPLVVDLLVNGDWEEQKQHDLARLISRPNPFYSGRVMAAATIVEYWTDGNAYWLKYRDSTRKPVGLYYVPYWMIEPKGERRATPDNFITHYEYNPYPGANIHLDPADIVHFRNGIDPHNPRKGLGKFKSLFREVMTDEEAANFTAALLANMGVPGIVISPSKDSQDYVISPQEAEATKQYIKQSFTGDHRGEPLAFQGPVQVHQFGFSPEQLSLEKVRRIPEERISGVVGVAAIVAGLGAGLQRSTFANFAEAREASYEENIIPSQETIAADVDTQLLPDFEPNPDIARSRYDLSNVRVLQEDKNKESERVARQFEAGIIQQAEARAKLGYDFEPEQQFYLLPLNKDAIHADDLAEWIAPSEEPEPVISVTPPAQLPAPGATTVQDDSQTAEAARQGVGTGAAARRQPVGLRGRGRANTKAGKARTRHTRFMRIIEKRTSRIRVRFESRLHGIYDDIGSACGSAYTIVTGKAEHDDIIDDILEMESVEAAIAKATGSFEIEFKTTYAQVGSVVFEEVASFLDIDLPFDDDSVVRRQIVDAGGKRAALPNLGQGIRADIRAAISDGIAAGEGPRVIARRISAQVGSTAKAETIARTEVKYAQNVASIRAYEKAEIVTGLQAFDNQTGYGDDDCTERDGKVYTFEEAERLTAEEHPNGTLSWAPVTERG